MPSPDGFVRTERTTSLRVPEKLSYDKPAAYAILDEAKVCHVGYAADDGRPRVLPTVHARLGDTLYVHGSTGSRVMLGGRGDGVDVCVTVTLLDGLVFSRSWFHHSANYRCVVAHGAARMVTDAEEKWRALAAIVDSFADGRSARSRPPTDKELAQTAVLSLSLREVSVKVRSGGPKEDPADLGLPYWAGHVPLTLTPGAPIPDPDATVDVPDQLPGVTEPTLARGGDIGQD